MNQNTLQQAISSSKFEEIETILKNDANEFDTISKYNVSTFFQNLIKNKQFSIIELLIDSKKIETDLYEYESYSNTIFPALFN